MFERKDDVELEAISTDTEEATPTPSTKYEDDVATFGIWADTEVLSDKDNRIITVIIDKPLPDKDTITITTDTSKAASMLTKAVAGQLLASGPDMKFFDGR